MELLILILLLVTGAVCFGLATFGSPSRINLVPLGLLCWVLTVIIPTMQRL